MSNGLIKIGEAAKMLNISIDTLRRWDKAGYLKSVRPASGGHRYYNLSDIEILSKDNFIMAKQWVTTANPLEPQSSYYCPDAIVFQTRLSGWEKRLQNTPGLEQEYSLITSTVGEIGNNSFDHNLGSWPDIRGIFFACDLNKKQIALADRGQGILQTLKRVKPDLASDEDALRVAFTEKISGRAPEARGNGLKFVRAVIASQNKTIAMNLRFQSGQAGLELKNRDSALHFYQPDFSFRGCLALITFNL